MEGVFDEEGAIVKKRKMRKKKEPRHTRPPLSNTSNLKRLSKLHDSETSSAVLNSRPLRLSVPAVQLISLLLHGAHGQQDPQSQT